jgi:hypothetical protein
MRSLLTLALAAFPLAAQADDPPLSADAFEAFVTGKTFDTHDETGRYGVETFLANRRAIWRDASRCLEGTWRPQGDQICFDYQGEPYPYCWTYHDQGNWLTGFYEGNLSNEPIKLYPAKEVVTCEGYFGV